MLTFLGRARYIWTTIMLRFLTAGESHGPALTIIVDGFPAGVAVDIESLNDELASRQKGYGRGARQKIETDKAEFSGGVRLGTTTGAPLAITVRNRDFDNWQHVMSVEPVDMNEAAVSEQFAKKAIGRVRPGHADLPGAIKFRNPDIRNVLERASARETAARVSVGGLCLQLLERCGVRMAAHVITVGPISTDIDSEALSIDELKQRAGESEMSCVDAATTESMKEFVKKAWQEGDSVGGVIEIIAEGLPVGLGSYTQWDERLDGQLAQAVMSVQAVKACEIGDGVAAAGLPGSQVHDALEPGNGDLPFKRSTNRAGGLEGGMTNGSRLRLRAYMKPIPTMRKGLASLSVPELEACVAHYERSDVCAVPACAVVVKSMVAFVLARSMLSKFGSDTHVELLNALERHRQFCQKPFVENRSSKPFPEIEPEMELE